MCALCLLTDEGEYDIRPGHIQVLRWACTSGADGDIIVWEYQFIKGESFTSLRDLVVLVYFNELRILYVFSSLDL